MSRSSTTEPHAPANESYTLPVSKSGVCGPRKMEPADNTGPHIEAYTTSTFEQAFEYAGERGNLGIHGPRLSIDHTLSSGHTLALRRQSTKQLIHRFESMTDAGEAVEVKRHPGSTRASPEAGARDAHRPFLTAVPHKTKRRSLSNSLRNFMSVFKKKKDKESDDEDYVPPFYAPELNVVVPRELAYLPKPQVVSRTSGKEILLSSSQVGSALSGSLLYLLRPPSRLPVWMSCTVTLYDSHLLLTWYSMHDTPSGHTIQLDGFVDVRSLNERVSRPETEGDLKTFELTFEGRPRETFAATSSQDRARWVGAIW